MWSSLWLTPIIMHVSNSDMNGPVTCRDSVNCAGGALGTAMSGRDCCLGNSRALAYTPQGSEDCIACVGEFYRLASQTLSV